MSDTRVSQRPVEPYVKPARKGAAVARAARGRMLCAVGRLLTILSATLPASTLAGEAEDWLERMGTVLRAENYAGIFTYVRGSEIDSVRIVHRVENGREYERLIHLNGEPREIYTEGSRSECLHLPDASIDAHGVPLGPFARSFRDNLALNRQLYEVRVGAAGRVADRPARQLLIQPRRQDRYGYELWLDEATGLLLQSVLVDRGEALEAFQFARVEVGGNLPPEAVASTLPEGAGRHLLTDAPEDVSGAAAGIAQAPEYEPAWLPEGFMRVRVQARDNHLSYSDGLATFSLFVETPPGEELPDLVTRVGGTVMVTQRLAGSSEQVTLVGELPAATAKRVADSVRRVVQ